MALAPLTPQQQKAADLIGQGWKQKLVAAEVGVSSKTVQRWNQRDDFRALVSRRKQSVASDNPTARATLEEALAATKSDGTPDWRTRVSAARALVGADGPVDGDDPTRETVIHADALEDG